MKIVSVKEIPPAHVTPPLTVTVELNEKELVLLDVLMRKIGGIPDGSYRRYADTVSNATDSIINGNAYLEALRDRIRAKIDTKTNSSIYFMAGE